MHRLLLTVLLLPCLSAPALATDTLPASIAGEVETDSQTWRSAQVDYHYVIQLVSVRSTQNLPDAAAIRDIKAVDRNLDVVYHPKQVNGTTWHTLVWGPFGSKASADAMFSALPARWQKNRPWVRPISSIVGAAPAQVVELKPEPVAIAPTAPIVPIAPVLIAKAAPQKHPVSPPDRSQFSSRPLPYADPYENHGEDFSNHESALAAQGTYPYVKVSLGQAEQDSEALKKAALAAGSALPASVKDSYADSAYEVALGLDLGYYLGVELGYTDTTALAPATMSTGSVIVNPALAAAFKEKAPYGFQGIKASGLLKLPIDARRRWQPFVQIGAMRWEAEIPAIGSVAATSYSDTNLFYAAGLDYKFSKYWALGIKYTGYDLDAEARALSADLTWRWEGRN